MHYAKKYFNYITLLVCILCYANSYAQNLVPNPSFEDNSNCPTALGEIGNGLVDDWTSLSTGCGSSADYFNACAGLFVGVPNNNYGSQAASDGDGYAGILAYDSNGGNCRSYVAVQLSSPLVAGSDYCVSFKVSLADYTYQAVENIGLYFSNFNTLPALGTAPDVANTSGVITDQSGWVTISGSVTANAAYDWLIIGNFADDSNTNFTDLSTLGVGQTGNLGYYYIDEVSVEGLEEIQIDVDTGTQIGVDTVLVCVNDAVNLTATSSASSTYTWSPLSNPFDTLPTTTNQLSINAIASDGYIVSVYNDVCVRTDTVWIEVAPVPIPNFTVSGACAGGNTLFLDTSTGSITGSTYTWDFDGDGTVDATTLGGASYSFPAAGDYTVTLQITNGNNCTESVSKTISIAASCNPCASTDSTYNLVPNPNVEIYTSCPNNLPNSTSLAPVSGVADSWLQTTDATSDFFHSCSSGNSDTPTNGFGTQIAFNGNGYLGFYATQNGDYREYVTSPLLQPLEAGKNYCVSFYVNLADKSGRAVDNIGLHFSNGTATVAIPTQAPLSVTPQISNPSGSVISDKIGWTKISGTYTATGGEDYITIGNFFGNSNTTIDDLAGTFDFDTDAYYYLDNVVVTEIPDLDIVINGSDIRVDSIGVCVGDTLTLSALGAFCTYEWVDLSNNTIASTTANLGLSSNTSGVVDYLLTTTSGTCSVSKQIKVYYAPVPVPSFTIVENCAGGITVFTDTSTGVDTGASYEWVFGDGDMIMNVSGIVPHLYVNPGTYDVQLTITNPSGCSASTTFSYTVDTACDPCSGENNLVSNPSFETATCPDGAGDIALANAWLAPEPNDASDLFGDCNTGDYGVPNNLFGTQNAFDGNNYGGIIAYSTDGNNVIPNDHQFITGEMPAPLTAGETYCVSMQVSLADSSDYAIDELGIYFSDADPTGTLPASINNNPQIEPQIKNPVFQIITNKSGWTEVTASFTATSANQYLTIGNFEVIDDSINTILVGQTGAGIAYYYVDQVSVLPISVDIIPVSQDVICEADSVVLTATSNTCDYYWIAENDPNNILSTDLTFTAYPTATTTYIFVGSNGNSCSVTDTVTIQVNPLPSLDLLTSDIAICEGEQTTITVNPADNITIATDANFSDVVATGDATNNTFTLAPANTTTYFIKVEDTTTGCENTGLVTVTVNPVPVATVANSTVRVCQGDSVRVLASGGDTYSWTPANILSNPNVADPFVTPTTNTTLTVTVSNAATGCSSTATVEVIVQEAYPTLPVDTIDLCLGDTSVLNIIGVPTDASTYTWTPFVSLSAQDTLNPTTYTTTDITYTLAYVDSLGCDGAASVHVRVNPVPSAGSDVAICEGGSVQLNASSGGLTYQWTPSAGLDNAAIQNPVATPGSTTTYTVAVTYANGNASCTNTDEVTVFVNSAGFAQAGPDQTICSGESVQLNALGGSTYVWTPATDLDDANIQNPTATPTATTTYTVQVTNSATGCTSEDQVTINVRPAEAPVLQAVNPLYCAKRFDAVRICLEATYGGCDPLAFDVTTELSSNVTFVNDTCFEYTSAFSGARSDTLDIQVCAGDLCDNISTTIVYCDLPPTWAEDTLQREICVGSTSIVLFPTANDPDADDALNITTSTPSNGTLSNLSSIRVSYTPDAGFTGTDQFSVYVCDSLYPSQSLGGTAGTHCDTVQVLLDVLSNQLPVAGDITLNTLYENSVSGCFSISDPDGDALTTNLINNVDNGILSISNSDTCVNYTPNAGFVGTDFAEILVCDDCQCDTTTITFNVFNSPPTVNDTAVTTAFQTAIGVCLNIVEPDGDNVILTELTAPTNGGITIANDSCVVYQPNVNFTGTDVTTITVCDPLGLCDTSTITITVLEEPNEPPVSPDEAVTTPFETATTVCLNVSDPDGDNTITTILTLPSNGTATEADSCITYTPNNDFTGIDTIVTESCDPLGLCDTAITVITVLPSAPPVVADTCLVTTFNQPIYICLDIVEPNGDAYSIAELVAPMSGSTQISNDSCFIYIQNVNFVGRDSLQMQVCDEHNSCSEVSVCVDILAPPNNPPIVPDTTVTTPQNTPIQVCMDITELDGETTTFSILDNPNNGAVVIDNDSCVTYTPNTDFSGMDDIQVTVCDSNNNCTNANIFINVPTPQNDPPVAQDTTICTAFNTDFQLCLSITDPDGDDFNIAVVSGPFSGGAMVDNDSCLTYTPNNNYSGNDSVYVAVCDVFSNCDTILIPIKVLGATNLPPIVPDTTVNTAYETAIQVCLPIVEPEGDPITFTILNNASSGVAVDDNNNSCITYTPNAGFIGTDVITVEVCDNQGNCDQGIVTVNVAAPLPNQPPVVGDTVVTTSFETPILVCLNISEPDNDPTVTTIPTNGSNGNAVLATGDTCITYTPDASFVGQDVVTIEVCDDEGLCDTGTVTINVLEKPNMPPIAPDTLVTTAFETPIQVCLPVVEPDGEVIIQTSPLQLPANGSYSNVNTTCINYTPDAGFSGTDTIQLVFCDPNALCDVATVVIDVAPNSAPIANDTTITTVSGQALQICPTISDPNGHATDLAINNGPFNGGATVDNNGCLTYTSNPTYDGSDQIEIVTCDIYGLCDTATIFITVLFQNQPPVAPDTTVTTPFETPIQVCLPIYDPNDTDFNTTIIVQAANGMATLSNDSCISYTPNADFFGRDSIQLQICDGDPNNCATPYIYVDVQPPLNQAPIVLDENVTTPYETPIQVCMNITEPDGQSYSLSINGGPFNGGSVAVVNTDCVNYVPPAGYTGGDNFTVLVCDPFNLCTQATVVVTIQAPTNLPPSVPDTTVSVPYESTSTICLDVTDPDSGDTHTTTIINPPDNGGAAVTNNTCINYASNVSFSGNDSLQVVVCDNGTPQLCDTANVFITVEPEPNNAPVVENVTTTTPFETPTTICLDITEPDGNDFTLSVLAQASNGNGLVTSDSCITYTPNPGFEGTDTVIVRVCDDVMPVALCDEARVIITVSEEPNEPPVVSDATVTVAYETTDTICVSVVEPEGETYTLTIVNAANNGTATIVNNNCIEYVPNTGFTGGDEVEVQACDPNGNCDTGTITITVSGPGNNPPEIEPEPAVVVEIGSTSTICFEADDPDNDNLSYSITNISPDVGTTSIDANCVTYIAPTTTGDVVITVEVCDDGDPVLCDETTVTITVNAPPTVEDEAAVTEQNTPISVCLDITDPDGDDYEISITDGGNNGNTVVESTNCILYSPDATFAGNDTVFVEVCDVNGFCDQAMIVITVIDEIIAVDDNVSVESGNEITFNVTDNDAFTDLAALTITVTSNVSNGTLTNNEDGTFTYIPNDGFTGTDEFTYQICDPTSGCDDATVIITVTDDLIANDDSATTFEEENVQIDVAANDAIPNGDVGGVTVTVINGPSNGGVIPVPGSSGTLEYLPASGFTGTDQFTYTICYDGYGCDTAVVTITVLAAPEPPVAEDDTGNTTDGIGILLDILANDTDVNDALLTLTEILDMPDNGMLTDNMDGTVTYTPNAGYTGVDSFAYIVCDSLNLCDTAWAYITITSESCDIVPYNAISPNGDSMNDVFVIDGVDCDENAVNKMLIYNRWGNIVYEVDNYSSSNFWDGTYKGTGKNVPDGTYFYVLQIEGKDDVQGFIEVHR